MTFIMTAELLMIGIDHPFILFLLLRTI